MSAPRAPRVLVSGVVLSQPMGGVRRHNAELLPRLARLLARDGGELAVLAPHGGLPFELPTSARVLPSRVPAGPPPWRALFESRALCRALAAARARGAPYDVVHSAHLPAPRVPVAQTITIHDLRALELRGASLADAPALARRHATSGTPGRARRTFARPLLARALARARAVVTVSETVRAALLQGFAVPPERVFVVPNGADHLALLPRRVEPGAALLHVGHLEWRKNLELLVAALAADPGLPRLELVGADRRGEGARLARLADELGVEERVRFLGPVADERLPELYAEAACVVLPSWLEGFGIGAVEAMRARVPLAVSTAGALREVTGPDIPCFPPNDPRACARAIRAALATSPRTLDALAERAAGFTWDASAEKLAAVLAAARV